MQRQSPFRVDLYARMGRDIAISLVVALAMAWLGEHAWHGFVFAAVLGVVGAIGFSGYLAWWFAEDAWSWWRNRPPDFVVRHSKFFYFFEPVAVAILGASLYFAHWFFFRSFSLLGTIGWLLLLFGVTWLLLRTEEAESTQKITGYQLKKARVAGAGRDVAEEKTARRTFASRHFAGIRHSLATLLKIALFLAVLALPSMMCAAFGCEEENDEDSSALVDSDATPSDAGSSVSRPDTEERP